MRRGPHAKRSESVVVPGTEMRVFVEASLDQGDRRACLCSSRVTGPRWRSSGVVRACSGLRLRRDTSLVTTAQVSAACLDLLSHVVEDGGVFVSGAFVSVMGLFVWWCLLRPVMYQCCFFLYDIAVLLLYLKKDVS
jgi:hypothetical protein